MRIARRFNAGSAASMRRVPEGRLKCRTKREGFSRASGTMAYARRIPPVNRRATIGGPSGTSSRRVTCHSPGWRPTESGPFANRKTYALTGKLHRSFASLRMTER